MADQQAGWYPDPSGDATKLRYWDGAQWTDNYTAAQAQPAATGTYEASAAAQQNEQPAYAQATYTQPTYTQVAYAPAEPMSSTDQTLRLVAFILCVISTVCVCWAIIPLAWMIPMTVHCWGIYKGTKANTTAFGVCTLIFVSLVSGILLLISKKDA